MGDLIIFLLSCHQLCMFHSAGDMFVLCNSKKNAVTKIHECIVVCMFFAITETMQFIPSKSQQKEVYMLIKLGPIILVKVRPVFIRLLSGWTSIGWNGAYMYYIRGLELGSCHYNSFQFCIWSFKKKAKYINTSRRETRHLNKFEATVFVELDPAFTYETKQSRH